MDDKLSTVKSGKSYADIRSEIAQKDAEAKGCIIVKPQASELFVDIDTREQMETFDRNIQVLQRREQAVITRRTPSPSGADFHYHIVVRLARKLEPMERVLLQAVLGSDPMRELLSWQRIGYGDTCPTLFFEKP